MSQSNKLNPMPFCRISQTERALLADSFCPLLQLPTSALGMSRGWVAQDNGLLKTRQDASNSLKMDPQSCASSLKFLQNLCESNLSSMRSITLTFPKFLLSVEMDRMTKGKEGNGHAPSLSHPWKAPSMMVPAIHRRESDRTCW